MAETLRSFPFWVLNFNKNGDPTSPSSIDAFIKEVNDGKITDLFVFSHGWNNDRTAAMSLYDRFFGEVQKVMQDSRWPKRNPNARIGVAGVIWPSILWPDDAASATMDAAAAGGSGGAAGLADAAPIPVATASPREINIELKKGYTDQEQQSLVDDLTALLEAQPKSTAALAQFRDKLAKLLETEPADGEADRTSPDYAEAAIGDLDDQRWNELLGVLGDESLRREAGDAGGGVGLGDQFQKLWAGAKDALRVATYWQMKQRAGIVGRKGLGGVVLTRLANEAKNTRVHLLGHSFGARLVSFSLSGLPDTLTREASPVKSLLLLQGAFSHYAFADHLPHDATRSGALKGMANRVDGPLLTTHSLKDLAVGVSYPAASFVNRDDSADAVDQASRWGAMGHDGAQAVSADTEVLSPPGTDYRPKLKKGRWLNLDGNGVIIHGGLPSGAHSDIVSPHTAWAALSGAELV